MRRLPSGLELQARYDVTCPKCGHKYSLAPCFAMQMGLNTGHYTCHECKTFVGVHIEVQDGTPVMVSWEWETHLEKIVKPAIQEFQDAIDPETFFRETAEA